MADFDLKEIYRDVFGYEPPQDYSIAWARPEETYSRKGQPYREKDIYGREFFLPITLGNYLLPFATIEISCKKSIVRTALPEQPGTVKEITGREDYQISIKGIAVNNNNVFPETEITRLEELFSPGTTLVLRNVISDIFLSGAHNVVITEFKLLRPNSGVHNARGYEMTLESDDVYTLEMS
ncbi:MAG: hypothetical protein JO154_20550 [Chitinophaga sp.]|uniref:DUF6046 domain-containing protein n=1 Tax=Chitinophaga sp. TaxID=1869181 RepID=UPI0025BCC765|nr:DUF6046 domain-containing protein [Chitinophaga sp.]MBV8255003.1 hypothetical protein [Chitinophaga sp.]